MSLREHEPMLAALASGAERRNRPTSMVALCAALLVGAGAYALWSARSARAAHAAFVREAAASAKVEALAAQVVAIEDSLKSGPGDMGPYTPRELLGSLASAATSAGLTDTPSFNPTSEETADSPLVRKVIIARLLGKPLAPTLAWIEKALTDIPGLYVTQFNLKPTRQGWEVEVRFARWETKQQS